MSSLLLSGSQPRDGTSDLGGEWVFKAGTFSSGHDRHGGEIGGGDEVEHSATQHVIIAFYRMHTFSHPDSIPSLMIAGNCWGLISLTRLEGPADCSFEGFLLTLFPEK
jgi:hypothetical protein